MNEQKEIMVYTTQPCAYCSRVKGLLASRELEYTEVNLSRDHHGRMELVQRTGMLTFPQVLIGGQLLGGYAETLAAADSGELDELLAA
jgi:glutaredoxin 3